MTLAALIATSHATHFDHSLAASHQVLALALHCTTMFATLEHINKMAGHHALASARQCFGMVQGWAYVEFGSNNALQKAVDLPNPELHGRTLTIKVSKPPDSNATGLRGRGRGRGGPARGFGGGRGDRGRSIHQHERLAMGATSGPAFVPRTVVKQEGATGKAPTNEDFRKLLQKK